LNKWIEDVRLSEAVGPEELIRWAVEEGNYQLSQVALYEHFKDQISFHKLIEATLPDMDDRIFEVDDEQYKVIPPHGTFSRKVERIEKNTGVSNEPEANSITRITSDTAAQELVEPFMDGPCQRWWVIIPGEI